MIFLLFFTENRILYNVVCANCLLWLCKLSPLETMGDNLHETSKPFFSEKLEKYFRMSSAEHFTQHAKC